VPAPVVGRSLDAVAVVQADVEPDGRVERAVLVQAEGGELVVEAVGVFLAGEVAVLAAPVADGAGDAVDELADAGLALGSVQLAVEILAGDDVGGELAPGLGDLAIDLLENDAAALVLDGGCALFPFELVVGADALCAEDAGDGHPLASRKSAAIRA